MHCDEPSALMIDQRGIGGRPVWTDAAADPGQTARDAASAGSAANGSAGRGAADGRGNGGAGSIGSGHRGQDAAADGADGLAGTVEGKGVRQGTRSLGTDVRWRT